MNQTHVCDRVHSITITSTMTSAVLAAIDVGCPGVSLRTWIVARDVALFKPIDEGWWRRHSTQPLV